MDVAFGSLQEQVYTLFHQFVPKSTTSDGDDGSNDADSQEDSPESPDSDSARSRIVVCRDLPHLLSEFEKQRSSPLVEDETRAQLETLCEQFPDQPIACDDLVKMIENLQNAAAAAGSADGQNAGGEDGVAEDALASSSASSASSASSHYDDDGDAMRAMQRPERQRSSSYNTPFPTSSTGGDTTIGATHGDEDAARDQQQRNRTSSASAAQSRASAGDATASAAKKRERHRSNVDARSKTVAGSDTIGREILKGKGRAPPSSWSRPRPQALAARSRRTSSAASSMSIDTDDGRSEVGSASPGPGHGTPSGGFSKRHRQTSQPIASTPERERDESSFSFGQLPRSVSSGYVFPRATSPGMGDETWYAEQEERWERGSAEGGGGQFRARSPSSRGASPGLDSPISGGGFQAFSALSNRDATSPRQGLPRSASHNNAQGDDYWAQAAAEGEELEALQRRYDHLARMLQEKERTFEGTQSMHETTIAELESRVEQLQERIHTLSKSCEEMKHKEQRYLDEISRLEGDLAMSVKRGEGLERTRDVMSEDLSRREQSIATLQGKVKELQDRVAAADVDEAEHFRHQGEWERDREGYREELDSLRTEVQKAQESQLRIVELESEREALEAQLRSLHGELEEARRNSGFLHGGAGRASVPPSMSKRLGAELASVFGAGAGTDAAEGGGGGASASKRGDGARSSSVVEAGGEGGEEEDGDADDDEDAAAAADASSESIVITTTTRRSRRSRRDAGGEETSAGAPSRLLTDTSTQTDSKGEGSGEGKSAADSDNAVAESSPPTYDEAAMEKAIIARLHPIEGADADDDNDTAIADTSSEYATVVDDAGGVRCTVLETALARRPRQHHHRRRRRTLWSRFMAARVHLDDKDTQTTSGSSSSSAPPSQSTLMLYSLTTMAVGVLLGSLYAGNGGAGFVVDDYGSHVGSTGSSASGVVFEDGTSWQMMNFLAAGAGYPIGATGGGGETLVGGMLGFLARVVVGSARNVGGGGAGGAADVLRFGVPI